LCKDTPFITNGQRKLEKSAKCLVLKSILFKIILTLDDYPIWRFCWLFDGMASHRIPQ